MKRLITTLTAFALLTGALSPFALARQEDPVSRAGFVCLLWAYAGMPGTAAPFSFDDVEQNAACAEAVGWGCELSILRGTGGGCFSPDRPMTREEAAVILRRYAAASGGDTFLPDGVAACNDYEGISPWADDSLYWATNRGILPWSPGGLLDPLGFVSPSQAEEAIARTLTA